MTGVTADDQAICQILAKQEPIVKNLVFLFINLGSLFKLTAICSLINL